MTITNVIDAIVLALESIDVKYVRLSQKDYSDVNANDSLVKKFSEEKILERPFAYEFYHRFRSLMEKGTIDFGDLIIQAEVDKTYQHCFKSNKEPTGRGRIPDFLVHLPNSVHNLAVIEFKLTSNLGNLEGDFEKLVEFKKNQDLQYDYGVEVIIGDAKSIERAKSDIEKVEKAEGEELRVVYFNTDSGKATSSSLKYVCESKGDWESEFF